MTHWLTLLSAIAAPSMSDLDAAVPEARRVLVTCAAEGCDDREWARAAWLVAVHRYVREGVADAELAASVRDRDRALFDALPDALMEAADEVPMPAAAPTPVPVARSSAFPIVNALATGTVRPGLYRNLQELRDNAPSVPWTDEEARTLVRRISLDAVTVELERGKRWGAFVGFSDGEKIFLHADDGASRARGPYVPTVVVDPFVVYEVESPMMVNGVWMRFESLQAIDLSRTRRIGLQKKHVRQMLADRPDELAAFEADRRRGQTLMAYVIEEAERRAAGAR